MKKVKFFAMMFAAGMLAACSDNLEDTGAGNAGGTTYEGETGYVNISLNLPTTSGNSSRANETFDDGLAAEYNVKNIIIALFYGTDEDVAKCKHAFKLSGSDLQSTPGSTDNITTYYVSGVRMISKPGDNENVYALAILNADNNKFDIINTAAAGETTGDAVLSTGLEVNKENRAYSGTWSELNTAVTLTNITDIATTSENGNFLMTNAPISNVASYQSSSTPNNPALDVTTLAPLHVYNSKAAAEGGADEIYVERAVAKVTVKVDNTTETSLTINDETNNYNGAKVTFQGWKLQNTNKSYYPIRVVNAPTSASYADWEGNNGWNTYFNASATDSYNRFIGKTVGPYRTYWAIDPNYELISTDNLSNNFTVLSTVSDWKNVALSNATTLDAEYCAENTCIAQAMNENQLTGILVQGLFTPAHGTEPANFFVRNNVDAIYLESEFLAWATAILNNSETEGVPLTTGETLSINTNASASTITNATGVQSLLNIGSNQISEARAGEIIKEAGNSIKFYKNGVTYYYTRSIRHFDDTQTPLGSTSITSASNYIEASHLGRFGVVRNNWYELTIESVSGPGEPTIPNVPTTPPDLTNSYINCRINVLSWAKRSQNVDL